MKTFQIRTVSFGQGQPKICVPIVGSCKEELMEEMGSVTLLSGDMVEWRADCYSPGGETESVMKMMGHLRKKIGDPPLLFTFRSKAEGGLGDISDDAYFALNECVIKSSKADMIDLELKRGAEGIKELIKMSRPAGVRVVLSYHNFLETPASEEILERLHMMQHLGADMTKIAVMPNNSEDVLRLLSLSQSMKEKHAKVPFIAVSMGEEGVLSRIAGGLFGSAVTYGAGLHASAPGQIAVRDLRKIMNILGGHRCGVPKRIFLIGFMGCGKTSVGRLLGEKLGYSFADMDELIETEQKTSIADIFRTKGEGYFRELESRLLVRLSKLNKTVISCGGGIVERDENIKILSGAGLTIFLKDDINSMYDRVKGDGNRPLVVGRDAEGDGCGGFRELYLSRLANYEQAAAISVYGKGKDPKQIVNEIVQLLQ